MNCEVLDTKPSGLMLVRLSCGCEQWLRILPYGRIHEGRRVRSCGPDGVHATPDFGERLQEAKRYIMHVFALKGVP